MQEQPERDWSGCEIVQFNPLKRGGSPTVRGRRINPDAFVDNYNSDRGYTPEFIACELFEEPLEDVRIILQYAQKKGWLARQPSCAWSTLTNNRQAAAKCVVLPAKVRKPKPG